MNSPDSVISKLILSLDFANKSSANCPPELISKDGLYLPFRFQNKVADDEKIFKVDNGLYIGTQEGAADVRFIKGLAINHVINLTSGSSLIPNYAVGQTQYDISYNNFYLRDNIGEDVDVILKVMDESINIINSVLDKGNTIMVHCNAGLSRSASVIMAYLMKSRRLTLLEAVKAFKRIRGRVAVCTPSYWSALFIFEKRLAKLRKQKVPVKPTYNFLHHICDDISVESGEKFSIMLASEKEIAVYLKKYDYNASRMIKDLLRMKYGK